MKSSLQPPIYINALSSISALGSDSESIWNHYLHSIPAFSKKKFKSKEVPVACVSEIIEKAITEIQQEEKYKHLDRSVLLALLTARSLKKLLDNVGPIHAVSIGSSRGATQTLEKSHSQYLTHQTVPVRTSPTTTLGNLGAWVGQELSIDGAIMEHSVTCSSGMFALLNGIAWIQSGMVSNYIAGASEAALTPFTLAQMEALKLYSKKHTKYPCESLNLAKEENTMVLGEGACLVALDNIKTSNTKGVILGVGTATEIIEHGSSISKQGIALQKSMQRALDQAGLKTVDAIVMHAPGTINGDLAEYNAVKAVFSEKLPLLTSNKFLLGHTLGTSGLLSLEMALLMLAHDQFIENPLYPNHRTQFEPLNKILINTIGFGGNAASIIVSKPS